MNSSKINFSQILSETGCRNCARMHRERQSSWAEFHRYGSWNGYRCRRSACWKRSNRGEEYQQRRPAWNAIRRRWVLHACRPCP